MDGKTLGVLYDAQIFTSQRFGGISRYFVELMRNMPGDVSATVSARYSHNVYINDVQRVRDFPGIPFKKDIVKALNSRLSQRMIARSDFDVFHPTYYNPYFLRRLHRPYVITVHDMIHERFPESFSKSDPTAANKRATVMAADGIIAISESTKRDLVDMYGLPSERITVIYHGHSGLSATETPPVGLPAHYVLFVGDRNRYKNFGNMVAAFAEVRRYHPGIKLVCTGRPFSTAERQMLADRGVAGDVLQYFVSDSELRYLYSHALCFVFPSLFEGFGFPVLESFAAGCPIVLSGTSSLPEVAGDGGVYFDPSDVGDMRDKIIRVIDDDDLRRAMVARGHEIVKSFTWQRTSEQTVALYRSVAR